MSNDPTKFGSVDEKKKIIMIRVLLGRIMDKKTQNEAQKSNQSHCTHSS
jgi:hypothetical protein